MNDIDVRDNFLTTLTSLNFYTTYVTLKENIGLSAKIYYIGDLAIGSNV